MGHRDGVSNARALPDGGTVAVPAAHRTPPVDADTVRTATITVPATVDGVATALSHLSAAHRTTGPERSHPSGRRRPPRLTFGETDVPADVRAETPETGITVRLPRSLQHLYVAAPLAYYLGAEVTVEAGARPRLAAPAADVARRLESPPRFRHDIASVLRRCFFLDALVRDVPGERLTDRSRLTDALAIEPAALLALEPADRLRAYLDVEGVEDYLPEWHLSTYVEPAPSRARSLPHLLDALSLIYPPEASELGDRERLRRSLDDFYRAQAEVPSVDVVAPSLEDGDLHAWLADGTPIEAYKTTHSAYAHGRPRPAPRDDDYRLAVVVNDEEMAAERTVADIYRDRSTARSVEVTVHERLRTDELADLLGRPLDCLHYVGHCEVDGLRCPDGTLSAASIEAVRTRTFFLNACGSFHQGRALVDRGSTAGAVTLSAVLDEQAATVGTTFARLLVSGFSVAPALDLARRRILMGTDYGVVGDGTATVVEPDRTPAVLYVAAAGDDRYRVRHEVSAPRRAGDSDPHPFRSGARLHGTRVDDTLDRDALVTFLRSRSLPVVHDGRFVWSEDLAARL